MVAKSDFHSQSQSTIWEYKNLWDLSNQKLEKIKYIFCQQGFLSSVVNCLFEDQFPDKGLSLQLLNFCTKLKYFNTFNTILADFTGICVCCSYWWQTSSFFLWQYLYLTMICPPDGLCLTVFLTPYSW